MGKLVAWLAALWLGVGVAFSPKLALAEATPAFTGTFLQLLDAHAAWTPEQWRALFDALSAIGVKEVIVQWTVLDDKPFYPSKHFKGPPVSVLEQVLAAARERGMAVTLGLVHDPGYWQKIERDPKLVRVYFKRLLLDSLEAGKELVALAGNDPAFAGFYIPQEIDDRHWLDPAQNKVLTEYLTDLAAGLRQAAPGKPVAIAGFSNAFAAPDILRELWENLLSASGIDRLLFQDGIGVGKLEPDYAGLFLCAASAAASTLGRQYTPVVETFTQTAGPPINDKSFAAEPAPLSRIQRQLAVAAECPHAGIVAFSLPEYLSPMGMAGAKGLYEAYKGAVGR